MMTRAFTNESFVSPRIKEQCATRYAETTEQMFGKI